MNVSEARLVANRTNSLASCGPKSPETRAISRQNSRTHGLTGKGAVVSERDAEEIARRVEALTADMTPRTGAGEVLIRQMALLSVRMERAAEQESAHLAMKVRHAADDFDDRRADEANALYETITTDPRRVLKKLLRSPEGIDRLIDAWSDLLADLAVDAWTDEQLEQAANLTGLKSRHARGSRLSDLNRAIRGDFARLAADDGAGLGSEERKAWAKARLLEQIEAEVAALGEHADTLDFEAIALDRAEAGTRALFDDSKAASLARRYEAEARRGFFKALKEFRQVEAEFAPQADPAPSPPAAPKVASFRETAPSPVREPERLDPEAARPAHPPLRRPENRPAEAVAAHHRRD